MLTVAHRVENGGRGEDRALVEHSGSQTFAIVADGGGAAAAAMACSIAAQRLRSGAHELRRIGRDACTKRTRRWFGQVGSARPLLIATDGLFKYATDSDFAQRAAALSVNDAVDKLIAGVRLLSGADDVAIILIECVV